MGGAISIKRMRPHCLVASSNNPPPAVEPPGLTKARARAGGMSGDQEDEASDAQLGGFLDNEVQLLPFDEPLRQRDLQRRFHRWLRLLSN